MMEWLESLKGGAPTVVGAVIGSLLGFITIVLGALFNAHLNRVRDDSLRAIETRAVAAAIRAELASVEDTLLNNSKKLIDESPTVSQSFFVPDLAHSVRMFPGLAEKVGLLADPSIITEVVSTYIVIDQYCETLLMAGGEIGKNMPEHRRIIVMPHYRAGFVAKMNAELAKRMRNTMNLLNRFLT